MSKIPFSKLQTSVNNEIVSLSHYNKNGEEIIYEVKYYLPIKEKMELISNILNESIDDNGFYNPIRVKVFTTLEIIYAYTNLTFTAKQKEDPLKLYDLLISTKIFENVINSICKEDWIEIQETVKTTIDNIYNYKNSIVGIIENVMADYNGLNLDATEIQKKIADPENLELLKSILTKLG